MTTPLKQAEELVASRKEEYDATSTNSATALDDMADLSLAYAQARDLYIDNYRTPPTALDKEIEYEYLAARTNLCRGAKAYSRAKRSEQTALTALRSAERDLQTRKEFQS